jgi:hypothetical protein
MSARCERTRGMSIGVPMATMSRRDVAAFGVLLVAALIWAAPLAIRTSSHLPGTPQDRDVVAMIWNVWWVQRAIEGRASWFATDEVLLPFGADLRVHTYGPFPAALVWPVARMAGVLPAFNIMVIGTIVLNGWLAYLLFRELPASRPAALVASAALMLGGPVLDQMRVGRPIYASLWITCAALLVARRLLARPNAALSLGLAATLAAALFTDFQMLLFTSLWLACLIVWTVVSQRSLDVGRLGSLAAAVAVAGVVFFALMYPALARATSSGAVPSSAEALGYSFRWWDYFTPSIVPRAIGGYEVALALPAGLWWMRHDRRVTFWLGATFIFLVLALGPRLQPTSLPLPFAAFHWWPAGAQFRTPYRLTIPAVIGSAAVMALVLDRLLAGSRDRWLGGIALLAVAIRVSFAVVQQPLQTQSYPGATVYHQLASAGDPGAIIEVPFGVRTGIDQIGAGAEVLQYYQHVHGRPIINAMIARVPPQVFAYYRAHPSLVLLAGEQVEEASDALAADLEEVIDRVHAAYVIVHPRLMTADQFARVSALLDGHPRLDRWVVEGDLIAYRVE